MPQSYQSILWASFYSPESFDQVPKAGETLHVEAPAVDSTKEGGVGFDDLQDLLKSSDRVDNEPESPGIMQRVIDSGDPTKPPSRRMLDIRVERACAYINPRIFYECIFVEIPLFPVHDTVFYPDLEIPEYTHKKMLALNHALLDWGGFATLKPMFGSTSPYNVNQEDVPVESESMRKVMNLAARITGRPDPSFETAKVEKTVDAVEVIKEEVVKEEVVNNDPGPTREHSRSWSLPSPSQGSPSPTPPSERTRTTRPVAVKAQAGAGTAAAGKKRKQQILGKIKQPASEKTKGTGGKNNSTRGGETQKQEWSTSKKESKNRLESAKPAAGLKNRIWDVVGKWF